MVNSIFKNKILVKIVKFNFYKNKFSQKKIKLILKYKKKQKSKIFFKKNT
jgi:hypothetical protein